MNKSMLVVGIVALLATFGANAQTKISSTAKCKSETSKSLDVGDRPGHKLGIFKSNCTYTEASEIAGQKLKEGHAVATTEDTSARSTDKGHYVATMEGGDKFFAVFQGTQPLKDGKAAGAETGTYIYTGGTGKLKGIKGKGTYRVTPNQDDTVTVVSEGEYTLTAGKAGADK